MNRIPFVVKQRRPGPGPQPGPRPQPGPGPQPGPRPRPPFPDRFPDRRRPERVRVVEQVYPVYIQQQPTVYLTPTQQCFVVNSSGCELYVTGPQRAACYQSALYNCFY